VKFYYSDYSHTIYDYFSALKKREITYEFFTPFVLSVLFYILFDSIIPHNKIEIFFSGFSSVLVNVFAILVGFTISAIAIFTTIDHDKIKFLIEENERSVDGRKITNFHFIYINLIYSGFVSILMLVATLSSCVLSYIVTEKALASFLAFGALHVLFLSIRNITTIYILFAYFSKK
jgi:hypothetical protein